VTGFSELVRDTVNERASVDGFLQCEVMVACQGRAAFGWHHHHRRVKGHGGSKRADTNQAANSLACCGDCHRYIHANPQTAYANGWLVKQSHKPSDVPVLRRHHWVLLSDDGTLTPADCVCGEVGSDGWVPGPCSCVEAEQ
jgi:hypothetical protein